MLWANWGQYLVPFQHLSKQITKHLGKENTHRVLPSQHSRPSQQYSSLKTKWGEVKKTKRKTPIWHADDETKINQFQIIKTIDVHVFNISKNSSSAVCVCVTFRKNCSLEVEFCAYYDLHNKNKKKNFRFPHNWEWNFFYVHLDSLFLKLTIEKKKRNI